MNFYLQRLFNTEGLAGGDFTCSHLTNRENFDSFAIEDDYNTKKIAGETRIPGSQDGMIYELKLRKELTDLTKKHREAYAKHPDGLWFKENQEWWHIEITGIPNYQFVYFHSGIDDSHSLGCVLPCFGFNASLPNNQGSDSVKACNKLYSIVHPLLESGKKAFVIVRDEIMK